MLYKKRTVQREHFSSQFMKVVPYLASHLAFKSESGVTSEKPAS